MFPDLILVYLSQLTLIANSIYKLIKTPCMKYMSLSKFDFCDVSFQLFYRIVSLPDLKVSFPVTRLDILFCLFTYSTSSPEPLSQY
jgi:hypothetical protein